MSRASNSLKASDITTTPIKLKYASSYNSNALAEAGIRVLAGINTPISVTGSVPQETINYRSTRHLYYQNFLTGSFPASASIFDCSIQSTAALGTLNTDYRYFPTGSNSQVKILSIPRNVFGENIARFGFQVTSSAVFLRDDGDGNIVDLQTSPYVLSDYYAPEITNWYVYSQSTHVGNIIYSQGIIVITNQEYINYFPATPVAIDNDFYFSAGSSQTVNIIGNDYSGNGTFDSNSVTIFGGDVSQFTNNLNGTITLNATSRGVYTTYYTVNSIVNGFSLTSNTAKVTITLD